MTYITENPWPLILILIGVVFVSFLTGSSKTPVVALICLVLCAALLLLERYLVSPREEVQIELHQMLDNFKSRDLPAITSQISSTNPDLVSIAERGIDLVELSESFHIRSAEIEIDDPETATCLVRANGLVTLRKHGGGTRHVATYWSLTWRKEDGGWKLKTVKRLNVATGEEQDYFSADQISLAPAVRTCRRHNVRSAHSESGRQTPQLA